MDAVFLVSPTASMLQTSSHSNNNLLFAARKMGVFFISQKLCSNICNGELRIRIGNDFGTDKTFFNMRCHRTLSIDHFVYKYEPLNQWWILRFIHFIKNNLFFSLSPPPPPRKKVAKPVCFSLSTYRLKSRRDCSK